MKKYIHLIVAIPFFFAACAKQEKTAPADSTATQQSQASTPKTFPQGDGRGIVKEVRTKEQSLVLDHNTIPNIMDAMTMAYKVDNPSLLTIAKVNDSVQFTLQDRGEGNYVVTSLTVIPKK